jgi:hypothetical protein
MLESPKALSTRCDYISENLKDVQWTISRKPTIRKYLVGSSETTRLTSYKYLG